MKMTVFFQDFELEEDQCFFFRTLAGKQTRKSFS
jgi:hypothetical protein